MEKYSEILNISQSDQENLTDSDESEIDVVDTNMESSDLMAEEGQQNTSRPQANAPHKTYHCVYCNNTFKSQYCYQV